MAAWISFTQLSVKIAHFLFIFIAVAPLLQSPLSKGHQHLARKGSELQVASEFARPVVSSEGYRRSKTTSESMVSAPRRIFCVVILAHELALVNALLLCNDIALNPGPVETTTCATCSKSLRSKQSFAECSGCLTELESARLCSACTDQSGSASDDNIDNGLFLRQGLTDIGAIKGFKIAHQNIRSIIGKIEELRLVISEVKSSFHLLTFSEAWATEAIFDSELEISGYQLFRRDRDTKGGGVLVYARNYVEVVRRPDLESPTMESLWIEVCTPKSHSFLVGVLYRPPTASNHAVKDYMPILERGLQQAAARGKEVIILSDLNCDLLATRNNTSVECKQLKGLLRSENSTQLIHQATRITRDSQTLLDIIATNAPHNIKESGVLSLSLSDHEFVYCIRKLNWVKTLPEVKCFRNSMTRRSSAMTLEMLIGMQMRIPMVKRTSTVYV